jgi:hypothetical protein
LCEISKSGGRREGEEEAEESNPSEASGLAWLSMDSSVAVVRELDNSEVRSGERGGVGCCAAKRRRTPASVDRRAVWLTGSALLCLSQLLCVAILVLAVVRKGRERVARALVRGTQEIPSVRSQRRGANDRDWLASVLLSLG